MTCIDCGSNRERRSSPSSRRRVCRPSSSTTRTAPASRPPSADTSTGRTSSRRRTATRSSCATPTSSVTLCAGGCVVGVAGRVWFQPSARTYRSLHGVRPFREAITVLFKWQNMYWLKLVGDVIHGQTGILHYLAPVFPIPTKPTQWFTCQSLLV